MITTSCPTHLNVYDKEKESEDVGNTDKTLIKARNVFYCSFSHRNKIEKLHTTLKKVLGTGNKRVAIANTVIKPDEINISPE